jgi:AAA domain, putative AbiEii toxin, Type IV TA system
VWISQLQAADFKSFADTGPLQLDKINVLVGRNNSGKSAILQAAHIIQAGYPRNFSVSNRIGAEVGVVTLVLEEVDARHFPGSDIESLLEKAGRNRQATYLASTRTTTPPRMTVGKHGVNVEPISNIEPRNLIYSFLAKRKVSSYEDRIDLDRTRMVAHDLQNLTARVDTLTNPSHVYFDEYEKLCKGLIGFSVGAVPSAHGKRAGISVGLHNHIYVEEMGEGVASLLGLITILCMADGNVILIEEPENDIHPQGLKALLEAIVRKSSNNQFIVTTHSNIVTRYLGSTPNSKVFEVTLDYERGKVPTSHVREIGSTPEARINVLRQLGYELYDFDLWDGWLILEESSAEIIIRNYLIPWFAPKLARVRTLAAGGTSKVEPTFEDFRRLFLFTHLEPQYKDRAWVVVDGDASGKKVVNGLREKYPSWPEEHFRAFTRSDFELYYPERFADEVAAALAQSNKQAKREAKRALCDQVKGWCDSSPEDAKVEFAKSATEVIELLREIEAKIT